MFGAGSRDAQQLASARTKQTIDVKLTILLGELSTVAYKKAVIGAKMIDGRKIWQKQQR